MNKPELQSRLYEELDKIYYQKLPLCKSEEAKHALIQQKLMVGSVLQTILSRIELGEEEELSA